ncbi:MAG TPA: PH domain-containing protein [Solirubrobacter sp.]|jgi:uncharacterized membrane protein YdbT with pleckstrin-like domain|nr:PH domain-containing protein [Solirubrobacter sp.]
MEMHADEEVIYEGHPSWRSTFAFYFKGLLAAIILAALAALVTLIADEIDWVIVVLVFAVVFALTILIGFVRRMFTVFMITNQRLRIQRGIIARNVQQTRIERVQNVNTEQGVIDRMLRVGAVDFDTAGTTDADFRFDGVDNPEDVVQAVDRAQREHSRLTGGAPADGL